MNDSYHEMAMTVVQEYLRSAVIIDDQWPTSEAEKQESPVAIDESHLVVEEPQDGLGAEATVSQADFKPPAGLRGLDSDTRLLDLRDAMIREGALACGFRYETPESTSAAIDLARRADIVVLDWNLIEGDGGRHAIEILKELRKGTGIGFICVFTQAEKPSEVRLRLEDALGPARGPDSLAQCADFRIGNLVFIVANKPWTAFAGEPDGNTRRVEVHQLFRTAVDGVASVYSGLLQLAMLEMTAKHRKHLPAILECVSKDMDPVVLAEANNAESPVSRPSGPFLAALVDEWRASLDRSSGEFIVLGTTGLSAYAERLAAKVGPEHRSECEALLTLLNVSNDKCRLFFAEDATKGGTQEQWIDLVRQWLRSGCREAPPLRAGSNWPDKDRERARHAILSAVARTPGEESAEDSFGRSNLALDCLFHQQSELPLTMTQGTVLRVLRPVPSTSVEAASDVQADRGTAPTAALKAGAEAHVEGDGAQRALYLICTTPACDAERPGEKGIDHVFSFIPARQATFKDAKRDTYHGRPYCVVTVDQTPAVLVAWEKRPLALRIPNTSLQSGTLLLAYPFVGQGDTHASNDPPPMHLEPIAQLRPEIALMIAAEAVRNAARIGVSRVELLRKRLS